MRAIDTLTVFHSKTPLRLPRDECAVRERARRDLQLITELTRETARGVSTHNQANELSRQRAGRPLDSHILRGAQAHYC